MSLPAVADTRPLRRTTRPTVGLRILLAYDDSLDRLTGVAHYVTALGMFLQRAGHTVAYAVGASAASHVGGAPVHSLATNMPVRFNGNRLSMPVHARRGKIRALLTDFDPDVLHVQMPYSPVLAGRLIRRVSHSTAVVATFHVAARNGLARCGAQLLAATTVPSRRRVDRVISVSDTAADLARVAYRLYDCSVIPHMVDVATLRASGSGTSESGPSIVFVGALVPRKGVQALVCAFEALRDRYPGATLRLIGDGPLSGSVRRQVSAHRHREAITLCGNLGDAAKLSALASADVACFPSGPGESFGVVLLEAMAAGAGVVVGGLNPGHRGVLEENAAVLVDGRDPSSIARTVLDLLDSPATSKTLHAWQQRLVEQYDVRRVGPTIVDVYEMALLARRGRPPAGQATHTPHLVG